MCARALARVCVWVCGCVTNINLKSISTKTQNWFQSYNVQSHMHLKIYLNPQTEKKKICGTQIQTQNHFNNQHFDTMVEPIV